VFPQSTKPSSQAMNKPQKTDTYDVMFLMDPTRAQKKEAAIRSMEWMMFDIDSSLHSEICEMEPLKGFVFDLNDTTYRSKVPGKKCVLIHELVSASISILKSQI
jgi:hypothetical protein